MVTLCSALPSVALKNQWEITINLGLFPVQLMFSETPKPQCLNFDIISSWNFLECKLLSRAVPALDLKQPDSMQPSHTEQIAFSILLNQEGKGLPFVDEGRIELVHYQDWDPLGIVNS